MVFQAGLSYVGSNFNMHSTGVYLFPLWYVKRVFSRGRFANVFSGCRNVISSFNFPIIHLVLGPLLFKFMRNGHATNYYPVLVCGLSTDLSQYGVWFRFLSYDYHVARAKGQVGYSHSVQVVFSIGLSVHRTRPIMNVFPSKGLFVGTIYHVH